MHILWKVIATFTLLSSVPTHAQVSDTQGMKLFEEYYKTNGLDSLAELSASGVRDSLPIKQSVLETLVGITYMRTTKTLAYRHLAVANWRPLAAKMRGTSETEISRIMPQLLKAQSAAMACSVPTTRFMMDHGLKVQHVYYVGTGTYLFTIHVTLADCSGA